MSANGPVAGPGGGQSNSLVGQGGGSGNGGLGGEPGGAGGATAIANSLKTCSALQTLNISSASMSVRVLFVFDVDWC